jgi:hypothetical protein
VKYAALKFMLNGKFERKVCFVEIDPTLLVRLGTPDRFRPNYILVEPMLTTTTSKLLIYINFSVFIEIGWNKF